MCAQTLIISPNCNSLMNKRSDIRIEENQEQNNQTPKMEMNHIITPENAAKDTDQSEVLKRYIR